jgi:hypothetical protein
MKFLLLFIVLCTLACQPANNKQNNNTKPAIVKSEEHTSTDQDMASYKTLTVIAIQQGKDGYTASLKDDEKGLYTCTISIPNLEDNYVELKIGDRVKIAGDYAESHPIQIFAKRIQIVN